MSPTAGSWTLAPRERWRICQRLNARRAPESSALTAHCKGSRTVAADSHHRGWGGTDRLVRGANGGVTQPSVVLRGVCRTARGPSAELQRSQDDAFRDH